MFKIAILGCENSHADTFVTFIKESYPDVEVVGVYSDEADACERLNKNFGLYTAASYDEFVGKIDGLVVTARHGKNHLKYALPYIESGIPMFIDKPVTCSEEDALTLARECKKNGVRLTGGSCLIHAESVRELRALVESKERCNIVGGFVRAPLDKNEQYGGLWFYAQHLVQTMQEIFGYYPISVRASLNENGPAYNFVVKYDGFDVFLNAVVNDYHYNAAVCTKDGKTYVDGMTACPIDLPIEVFREEFREFYRLLAGDGQKSSYRDFISPVFVIAAMVRAVESGKEEQINIIPAEDEI